MSLVGVRQELADALSEVEGVNGYTKPPTALKPGDAWPRLGGLERQGPVYLVRWRVLVLLPLDEVAALNLLETLVPDLEAALASVGYVESYTPVTYQAGTTANHPAVEITLIRE